MTGVGAMEALGLWFYAAAIGLIVVGVYGMLVKRHLLRVLVALTLVESGVNLFLVAVGFRSDAAAPILEKGRAAAMVDPIPQALILTAIVIGVGVLAVGLALTLRVHQAYGTVDVREIAHRLRAEEDHVPTPARPAATPVRPYAAQEGEGA